MTRHRRPLLLFALALTAATVLLAGARAGTAQSGATAMAYGYVATLGGTDLPYLRSDAFLNQPRGLAGDGDGFVVTSAPAEAPPTPTAAPSATASAEATATAARLHLPAAYRRWARGRLSGDLPDEAGRIQAGAAVNRCDLRDATHLPADASRDLVEHL